MDLSSLLLACVLGGGTTWYVDDDGVFDPGPGDTGVSDPLESGSLKRPFDAIQEAIDAADDGDTVQILPGLYRGPGNRERRFGPDFGSDYKAITVRGHVKNRNLVVIDCQNQTWAFRCWAGEGPDVVIRDLTIANAFRPDDSPGLVHGGAAVDALRASPTISNCVFRQCRAEADGGALWLWESTSRVEDCLFLSCTASSGGAIVANQSVQGPAPNHVRISRSVFSGNRASFGGGAIALGSPATITDCTIVGNRVFDEGLVDNLGGGLYSQHELTVARCLVEGNSAQHFGGGVFLITNLDHRISDSALVGNLVLGDEDFPTIQASGGGAHLSQAAAAELVNCLVAGNEAPFEGGGLLLAQSGVLERNVISSCTIRDNAGGGVLTSSSAPLVVMNSILWGNEGYDLELDPLDTAGFYHCDVGGGVPLQADGGGNIDQEPRFRPAPEGGSWTQSAQLVGGETSPFVVLLTDSNREWKDNQLVGLRLNPHLGQPRSFTVISNKKDTVAIWADAEAIAAKASWVKEGADYKFYDDRLASVCPPGPCVDTGLEDLPDDFELPRADLAGAKRSQDGDGVGGATVDMGAFELVRCCKGDVNGDGFVDAEDLAPFVDGLDSPNPGPSLFCALDMNSDCVLDDADLALFEACLASGCGCP